MTASAVVLWSGEGSLVDSLLSLSIHPRHLLASQRVCVTTDVLPMLEAEARERQMKLAGKHVPERLPTLPNKLGKVEENATPMNPARKRPARRAPIGSTFPTR